ncbi:UNVERIFIED_CONTAM: hypothetical protein PYX00_007224 [Menopon gallinae]
MELLSEGRNFRLAQKEELPKILNFLEKYLPESLKFHQTIKTYLNDFVWEFHFYVARSWPDDPICLHFPGMTSSPNGLLYESFSVFCPEANLELLSLVEEEDVLLDWSKPIYLNFTHISITDRLERFYEGIGTVEKVVGDVYMCSEPKTEEQRENLHEEGFEIRQLIKEDVQTIHELYPANDMEAVSVFEKLITKLPAYGVFCSGELAAWMVQSYYGAMFSMQTRPEFRRRGYGILLARKLMNLVVERGYIPYVFILPENEASKSLYSKLGFQKIYQTVRAVFKPFASTVDTKPTSNI